MGVCRSSEQRNDTPVFFSIHAMVQQITEVIVEAVPAPFWNMCHLTAVARRNPGVYRPLLFCPIASPLRWRMQDDD
jgi:hypothetical protein